jgi:hypothetical protein
VLVAEASSDSWLTKNWRPITMLTFLAIIVGNQITHTPIPDHLWDLLELGIGGYVIGRSVEKTVPTIIGALKEKDFS